MLAILTARARCGLGRWQRPSRLGTLVCSSTPRRWGCTPAKTFRRWRTRRVCTSACWYPDAAIGGAFEWLTGEALAFSFPGLVVASMIFNLPFAVLPMQQAFAAIPHEIREAAWVSGLSGAATLARIELPIAWPGVLAAFVLTFAHTLGEFGVVLMVGGNIPSRTQTLSIAIYDRVQAFDMEAAGLLSALLLAASLVAMALVRALAGRAVRV